MISRRVGFKSWRYSYDLIEIYPYSSDRETLQNLLAVASECGKWGLPLMVEAVPFGWADVDKRTTETITTACRIASPGHWAWRVPRTISSELRPVR